ncbi:MAG TPA: hypothetical protein VGC41_14985 [Kofleriaceae bacterium]
MPRYERDEEVWQIEQLGKQLEITAGGKTTTRTFQRDDQARAQLAQLTAERVAQGFTPLARDQRHSDIETAIESDPENPASYSVYADWLMAQGDPRGQVMAAAIAADGQPDADKQFARALKKNIHELLGPLAPYAIAAKGDPDVFAWRFGVIHRAYLHAARQRPLDAVLDQLLGHVSGRFLVELALAEKDRIQEALGVLATRAPTSLRALRLWQVGAPQLGELWPALPRLRRLALEGRSLELGTLDLPQLEKLELIDSQMRAATGRAIALSPFPHLEQLRVDFGHGYMTGNATIDDVFEFLARKDVPNLRHLALVHTRYPRELVMELADSGMSRQLEHLDLSYDELSDANAIELARRRANFPKLQTLDVTGNRLSERGLVAIREVAATVRSLKQEP